MCVIGKLMQDELVIADQGSVKKEREKITKTNDRRK